MSVGDKSDEQALSRMIREVRTDILRLTQAQMSARLSVSQSNISRWEAGTLAPEPGHLLKIANLLAGTKEYPYFLEAAGVSASYLAGEDRKLDKDVEGALMGPDDPLRKADFYYAPLLRDGAAAGTPRAVDPEVIETYIAVPRAFIRPGARLVGMRIVGGSMSPLIEDSSIVIVDFSQFNAWRLKGRIVAARSGNEVTIKWFRQVGKLPVLVPHNTSPRYEIQAYDEEDGWSMIGPVVYWMGFPPSGSR